MKKPKDMKAKKDSTAEVQCEACGGKGYPAVQTVAPGRRIIRRPARSAAARGA
jgi:hypothetical protein